MRIFHILQGVEALEAEEALQALEGRADPSILFCRVGATEKSQTFFLKAEIFPALFSYIRAKCNTGVIRTAL